MGRKIDEYMGEKIENKANFKIGKIDVSSFMTSEYE